LLTPNRYFGSSLATAGPFFEVDKNQTDPNGTQPLNGWPLFNPRISFSTVSGFYDVQPNGTGTNYPWLNQYGWESFIAGIVHPTAIQFTFGDKYLDATVSNTSISNFESSHAFRTGVGSWSYTWSPEGCGASFNVSFDVIFSRVRPNVAAVKATITPTADVNGTVTDLLDGRGAVRAYLNAKGIDGNGTIYTSVHPNGLPNVTAYVVSGLDASKGYADISSARAASGPGIPTNDSTIAQSWDIGLKADETATFYKYIGVASNEKYPEAQAVARTAQSEAQTAGWDALLEEHVAGWSQILRQDKVDDYRDPVTGELPTDIDNLISHIGSVVHNYYLLQNLQPDGSGLNDNSIAVGGLTSDSYAGLIFWDADYWMAPGLNLNFPNMAKQIPNFRVKQHTQALDNAKFNDFAEGASLYSWTAGGYGNCTGTGPCVDYEYHLNADITSNMIQLRNTTGNATWFNDGPLQVLNSTAIMFSDLLEYNETTKTYWIKNMTDPDEYAVSTTMSSSILTIVSQLDQC
jgi:trehalose/maltose hydrolase-like predicted phosphorylase